MRHTWSNQPLIKFKKFCSSTFNEALSLMKHRGPDNQSISISASCILGHRRLSIIDLDNHSNQPMSTSCGQYSITFNGEIYNYKVEKT